jgi:hypothetical protein
MGSTIVALAFEPPGGRGRPRTRAVVASVGGLTRLSAPCRAARAAHQGPLIRGVPRRDRPHHARGGSHAPRSRAACPVARRARHDGGTEAATIAILTVTHREREPPHRRGRSEDRQEFARSRRRTASRS